MKTRTYQVAASTLSLEFGDLTNSHADVLVSSDDYYLTMGGGASAALLRAGGESIILDAAKRTPVRVGDVIVTTAGALPAKHILHAITIGPTSDGVEPIDILRQTTKRCLDLLDSLKLGSIAFPAIGTGVAGFSNDDTATAMAEIIVEHLAKSKRSIAATIFLFDEFGRRQPLDYVRFFEEFAIRSHRHLTNAENSNAIDPPENSPIAPSPEGQRRKEILSRLAELDRKREILERRLADSIGGLDDRILGSIEDQLRSIHEQRILALSNIISRHRPAPISAIISYCHADESYRRELGKHLSVLERQGIVRVWHDGLIDAGSEWRQEFERQLEASNMVLLLISADFISSQRCYGIEMRRALESSERGHALVVPILVRPVSLEGTPFSKLRGLPRDSRAVSQWPDRDAAYMDIISDLRTLILGRSAGNIP